MAEVMSGGVEIPVNVGAVPESKVQLATTAAFAWRNAPEQTKITRAVLRVLHIRAASDFRVR